MFFVSALLLIKALVFLLVSVPPGELTSVRMLLLSSVLMEMGVYLPLPHAIGSMCALTLVLALRPTTATAFSVPLPGPTVFDSLMVLVPSVSFGALSVLLRYALRS